MMAVTSLTENVLGGAPAGDDLRIDPSDPDHMVAVVQSAGLFETNDGGASWETRQCVGRADSSDSSGSAGTSHATLLCIVGWRRR